MNASLDQFFEEHFENEKRVLEWASLALPISLERGNYLKNWIDSGLHAEMDFMAQTLEKRLHPEQQAPWAKSIVLFLWSWPSKLSPKPDDVLKVSAYVGKKDYHHEIWNFVKDLQENLNEVLSEEYQPRIQAFADSAPVYERELARLAGLGWTGKNANLLNRKHGSAFFIGGFFIDQVLEKEAPFGQVATCGSCMICQRACPTGAILEPGKIDSAKCISYQTIENRKEIPTEIAKKLKGWIFGCDICQEVCPWNKRHLGEDTREFLPKLHEEWTVLLQKGGGFKSRLSKTAMGRAGRPKMEQNVKIVLK